jgi:hypothetical protein
MKNNSKGNNRLIGAITINSADESGGRGESRYELPGPGGPEGGPGNDYTVYAFVFLGRIIICPFTK